MHETTKTEPLLPFAEVEKTIPSLVIIIKNHPPPTRPTKERLIVNRGNSRLSIPCRNIAFIYAEMKIKFAVGFNNNRYITETALNDLEPELDRKMFFKLSRWIIVNINAVREFKAVEHSKMQVKLIKNRYITDPVIVSQVTAPAFKHWINNL